MVRSKSRDLPSILVSNDSEWKNNFKKVPDLHKRFLMEVCSLIVNTAELAQFVKAVGSVITQSAELLWTIWETMGNVLNRLFAGGGCLPICIHVEEPTRLNWVLIN